MSIPLRTNPVHLQSRRLLLRNFRHEDWPAVHAFRSDPAVARYMDFEANDEMESRQWLERILFNDQLLPRQIFNLAIARRDTGEVIGWIGIGPTRERSRVETLEVGYCLAQPFWGQGYMTEALARLVEFAFDEMEAARVSADCHPDNEASARVLKKVGMRYERRVFSPNAGHECLRFAITAAMRSQRASAR